MTFTRHRTAVGLAVGLSLLTAGIATADDVVLAGDEITAEGALDFGEVCVGDDVSTTLSVSADRQGGGAQAWANSATLSITAAGPSGITTGTSSIVLPSSWVTTNQQADNLKVAGPASLSVVVDTSAARTVDGELIVSAAGPRNTDGEIMTRTKNVDVLAAVVECVPADSTPPVIVPHVVGTMGNNGWYVSGVSLTWSVTDLESGIASSTGCDDVSITADQVATTYTCSATSAGGTASESVTIKRDATAPTIVGNRTPPANGFGWNRTDVTATFACDDNLSGVASCTPDTSLTTEGAGQFVPGSVVDRAGNSATTTVSPISIDKTAPAVSLVGGVAAGAYYPHELVGASTPTCQATDALSGLVANCQVSGVAGFPAVGSYTFGASAMDKADNPGSAETRSVTVLNYQTNGFFAPVDMSGVVNTVKSGSTVPLKFEVFAGAAEMTDIGLVTGLRPTLTACSGGSVDGIEETATGGTSLRYDTSGGQFIYNWQTPKGKAGACYSVTVTILGGQTISAMFQLK